LSYHFGDHASASVSVIEEMAGDLALSSLGIRKEKETSKGFKAEEFYRLPSDFVDRLALLLLETEGEIDALVDSLYS
jgi:hypothetical protein